MTSHPTAFIAAVLLTGLLTLASPAQAIFIETPLLLDADPEGDVGDELTFTIRPANASAEAQWADKSVEVRFSYDRFEGQDRSADAPVSNEGHTERIIQSLKLDAKASGTLTWTVPAEVDDRNVHVYLQAGDERLAFAYVVIGDAEPMMYAMSGPSDGQTEIDVEQRGSADETRDAPGLELIGLLAMLGAVVARRR